VIDGYNPKVLTPVWMAAREIMAKQQYSVNLNKRSPLVQFPLKEQTTVISYKEKPPDNGLNYGQLCRQTWKQ